MSYKHQTFTNEQVVPIIFQFGDMQIMGLCSATSGMPLKAQLICCHSIILCQIVIIKFIYSVLSFRFIPESAR